MVYNEEKRKKIRNTLEELLYKSVGTFRSSGIDSPDWRLQGTLPNGDIVRIGDESNPRTGISIFFMWCGKVTLVVRYHKKTGAVSEMKSGRGQLGLNVDYSGIKSDPLFGFDFLGAFHDTIVWRFVP